MLVLDNFSDLRGDKVLVPWYHIGHLSLSVDTELTVCYLPGDRAGGENMDEIVISPINFNSWDCLWRINASFSEKKGVVNDVLEILRESDLSVLQAETVSSENRDLHQLEIVCDARRLLHRESNVLEIDLLAELERRLIAYCVHNVGIDLNGNPILKVRQMKGLNSAHNKYMRLSREGVNPINDGAVMHSRSFHLPPSIMDRIVEKNLTKYLLVSDTKDRVLRIFMAGMDQGYTYVQIHHADRIGVLADITLALRDDFDIVNSLTKLQSQNNSNSIELLLRSSKLSKETQETERRNLIGECLKNGNLKQYKISYGFPEKIGNSSDLTEIVEYKQSSPFTRDPLIREETSSIIRVREQEIKDRKWLHSEFHEKNRRMLVLNQTARGAVESEISSSSIFISYNFLNNIYYSPLRAVALDQGFEVLNGEDPDEHLTMRDSIIARISSCEAFVGLWTGDVADFSPWLLWELGVAQTLDKPFKLLIAPEVPDYLWQKINSESAQYLFDPPNFVTSAGKALEAITRMIGAQKASNKALQRTSR